MQICFFLNLRYFEASPALSSGLDRVTSKVSSNLNYSGFVIVILHFHLAEMCMAAQGRSELLPKHVLLTISGWGKGHICS